MYFYVCVLREDKYNFKRVQTRLNNSSAVSLESGVSERHVPAPRDPFGVNKMYSIGAGSCSCHSQPTPQAYIAWREPRPFPGSMQSKPQQYRSDPVRYQFDISNIKT